MGPVLETIGNVLIREVSVFRHIDTLILCAIYMLLRHNFCVFRMRRAWVRWRVISALHRKQLWRQWRRTASWRGRPPTPRTAACSVWHVHYRIMFSSFVAMMVKTFQWNFLKHLSFAHLMLVFWQNNSKLDQDESLNFIVALFSANL